jgi:hypothetical protein|tara:strand:- start:1318 stop:1773 length:456 start_codon:yes stop_codon:yes gene_type:complete
MKNVGTWDSDLAILFLGCLLLPIGLYFLRAFFEAIAAARPIIVYAPPKRTPVKNTYNPPKDIGFTPSETWEESVVKISEPPKQRATKPKKKVAPRAVAPLTSQVVEAEAISGLCNMGYKKGDASKLVKSLSSKTKYDSAESLIKDCFMCIS